MTPVHTIAARPDCDLQTKAMWSFWAHVPLQTKATWSSRAHSPLGSLSAASAHRRQPCGTNFLQNWETPTSVDNALH